jgi:hypothetical protein
LPLHSVFRHNLTPHCGNSISPAGVQRLDVGLTLTGLASLDPYWTPNGLILHTNSILDFSWLDALDFPAGLSARSWTFGPPTRLSAHSLDFWPTHWTFGPLIKLSAHPLNLMPQPRYSHLRLSRSSLESPLDSTAPTTTPVALL